MTGSRQPAPAEAPSPREQAASLLRRVRDAPPAHRSRDEIALAGRLNGLLYLVGGLVALVALVIPGADIDPPIVVVAVAAGAIAWGVGVLRRAPWQRWHGRVSHGSSIVGLVLVAVLGPISGGHDSPFEDLVLLVVVSAAFFYTPRHALAYWLGCVVVLGLPLLYDDDAIQGNGARHLVVAAVMFGLVAVIIIAGRDVLAGVTGAKGALERSERELLDQQSSLRRVAMAVAAGAPPEGIFALVSSEAGRLLHARAASIARFDAAGGHAMVMGTWSAPGAAPDVRVGSLHAVGGADDVLARLRAGGATVHDETGGRGLLGATHAGILAAPVHTGTRVWGVIVAVRDDGAFEAAEGARLQEYADLIATAIANAEDRVLLQRQAGRDPLTDLLNHRAFHERVAEEIGRAQRHSRPLAVGVVDVDGFRELNDRVGVDSADAALVEIAARVRDCVRDEDVVARLIADRFAVIFVESDTDEAWAAAERVRAHVGGRPLRHGVEVTVSIGLCDLDRAAVADDLVRRAAAAVVRAKADGGDRVERHETRARSAGAERPADDVDRSHALLGLRALARAIDAKEPATREHSERVAALAARLAGVRGWDPRAVARLREAGLLHDVGKIGVPDAVLLKRAGLTTAEREVVEEHPALGAQMVAGILEDDQVAWIAGHHERPDGNGYPAGLRAGAISEGASLLALADAWDIMTRSPWGSAARGVDEALAEVRRLAGVQFGSDAVSALEALYERGELTLAAARLHAPGREVA